MGWLKVIHSIHEDKFYEVSILQLHVILSKMTYENRIQLIYEAIQRQPVHIQYIDKDISLYTAWSGESTVNFDTVLYAWLNLQWKEMAHTMVFKRTLKLTGKVYD